MKAKLGNTLAALRVVDVFVDKNAAVLPSIVAPATGQARLKAEVVELTGRVGIQDGTGRSARMLTQRKKEAKTALLEEHMERIRRTAVADLPHSPGLEKLMTVNRTATIPRLIQAAEGMAAAAVPFEGILVAGGLRPDFIDALRAAAKELETAVDDWTQARAASGGATKSLVAMERSARRTIAVIDAHVKVDLKHNPTLLNEWNLLKRPRKVASAPATTPAVPSPTPATPTTPATPAPANPVIAAAPATHTIPTVPATPALQAGPATPPAAAA